MDFNCTILGQAISFIIFVLFCMKYLWPPIISIIDKRQKEIADMFSSVEKDKKIAEIERKQASDYLEQAKIEAKLIITRANKYKTQVIDQVKYDAQIEQKKILLQTYKEINIKKICVAEELRKEMNSMIILGIEKILKHPINECVNHNIINEVLDNLLRSNVWNNVINFHHNEEN